MIYFQRLPSKPIVNIKIYLAEMILWIMESCVLSLWNISHRLFPCIWLAFQPMKLLEIAISCSVFRNSSTLFYQIARSTNFIGKSYCFVERWIVLLSPAKYYPNWKKWEATVFSQLLFIINVIHVNTILFKCYVCQVTFQKIDVF